MLIPKGITHSFSLTESCHLEKYWLHFTAYSEGTDLFSQFTDITVWDFFSDDMFTKLTGYFDQLFATERTNAVELSLLQQASLFQICALLFACSPEKIPSTLENAPLHSKKSVILKYIVEHLADSLTIEQLAKVVYMHPTAFIRYFKNRMGMPPLKYIKYLRLERALFQIFALLFACSPEKIPSTLENAPLHSKKSVILKYIDEHLADSLTIEQLAKVVYMHPTAFIRYFKNRMGMPPLKYIKYLRLERAKLYLETTDYAIQEIASLTGFTTASHFSREFKAAYGMSPAQDRKSVY